MCVPKYKRMRESSIKTIFFDHKDIPQTRKTQPSPLYISSESLSTLSDQPKSGVEEESLSSSISMSLSSSVEVKKKESNLKVFVPGVLKEKKEYAPLFRSGIDNYMCEPA